MGMGRRRLGEDADRGRAIVIMGVSGTGKTTVGEPLAERLGWSFLEGDDFHPEANVEKMRAGTPLDDDDRWPWLRELGKAIGEEGRKAKGVIAACSALKRAYRDCLSDQAGTEILFVLLHGERELLLERVQERSHDYMPSSLLDSQLATLERPDADEKSLSVDVKATPPEIVEKIHQSIDAA